MNSIQVGESCWGVPLAVIGGKANPYRAELQIKEH
jgi:hypothetical protein